MSVREQLGQYTFEALAKTGLQAVPNTMDKREGSILYDAAAMTAAQLAQAYIELQYLYDQSFADTAHGQNLERKVAEAGITRRGATPAWRLGTATNPDGEPLEVALGSRWAAMENDHMVAYAAAERGSEAGQVWLKAETLGSAGNRYIGEVLALTPVMNLGMMLMSDVLVPGEDEEDDGALFTRYLEALQHKPFGGNTAQYRQWLLDQEGVGGAQIYPVWDGGGTVKCVILGGDWLPASQEMVDRIQTAIDPGKAGAGIGIAPIGHKVTIATPEAVAINVSAQVTLAAGVERQQAQQAIEAALEEHFETLRRGWDEADALGGYAMRVYLAQISARMMQVPGVLNVTHVALDGAEEDMNLAEDSQTQQVPVVGSVTI